jgi:hypothetical protein
MKTATAGGAGTWVAYWRKPALVGYQENTAVQVSLKKFFRRHRTAWVKLPKIG